MATKTMNIVFTDEDADLASAQEEAVRLATENAALRQRVVFLRALTNRLQTALAEYLPEDEIDYEALLAEMDAPKEK